MRREKMYSVCEEKEWKKLTNRPEVLKIKEMLAAVEDEGKMSKCIRLPV